MLMNCDSDKQVRRIAVETLAVVATVPRLPYIIEQLKMAATDSDFSVRLASADALATCVEDVVTDQEQFDWISDALQAYKEDSEKFTLLEKMRLLRHRTPLFKSIFSADSSTKTV